MKPEPFRGILRASATPLAFLCAASPRLPELRVDPVSKPAGLGSAIHEALRQVAEGCAVPWDRLPGIADRWGVSEVDLRVLVAMGAKLWPSLIDRFGVASTEVPLQLDLSDNAILSGHVDLITPRGSLVDIGDWKTGRKDSDYRQQMRAYAALALADDPAFEVARVTVIWLRDAEIEEYRVTREDAEAWLADLRERVVEWDGVYRPGDHCQFCPRRHECQAAKALVRYDVNALLDEPDPEAAIATMEPTRLFELYRRAKQVETLADRVHAAIKVRVEQAGGELEVPGGRLVIEIEQRAALDTLAAWPVLEAAGFGDEELAACVEIHPSRAKDAAAKKAGKGKGAAAVRDLVAKLEAAGATRSKEVRKLTVRR